MNASIASLKQQIKALWTIEQHHFDEAEKACNKVDDILMANPGVIDVEKLLEEFDGESQLQELL
jgi:hypothetical protein